MNRKIDVAVACEIIARQNLLSLLKFIGCLVAMYSNIKNIKVIKALPENVRGGSR